MNTNIPLLPALVKRAKDAAWSVREGVHVIIHQVKHKTLTQLLELSGFEVNGYGIERQAEKDIVHLMCELNMEMAVCLRCKQITSTVKQYQSRCVRDLDLFGKRTFLHFQLR